MPDLRFNITGARAAPDSLTPLIHFDLEVVDGSDLQAGDGVAGRIQSIILQTQIRIEPTRRRYNDDEKERLAELFGPPEMWGRSLHSMHWADVGVTIPAFTSQTTAKLPVPVTFDLNVAATKYFFGLDDDDIPLLFLFSGSVFYSAPGGGLMVQRISWDREATFRLPVGRWRELIEAHYPDKAWLYLDRSVFDELYAFKQRSGLASWEAVVERLLEGAREEVL